MLSQAKNRSDFTQEYSYDQYGALKIGNQEAFHYLWLNPNLIIWTIDTPIRKVLEKKYQNTLSQEELLWITGKYNPQSEVSHEILKKYWYELVALNNGNDDKTYPNYVTQRKFTDGEEIDFLYKDEENFYRLIYAKAIKMRFQPDVNETISYSSWKIYNILKFFNNNK